MSGLVVKGGMKVLINKSVLFVSEAACLLGCSSYQVYRMIHEGMLPAYKDEGARAWKIPESSIQAYIQTQMEQRK